MCFVYSMPKYIMKIESSQRQVNDYWYVHVEGLIPSEGPFVSHRTCVGVLMLKLSKFILINFKVETKENAYTFDRIWWLFEFIYKTRNESTELIWNGYINSWIEVLCTITHCKYLNIEQNPHAQVYTYYRFLAQSILWIFSMAHKDAMNFSNNLLCVRLYGNRIARG